MPDRADKSRDPKKSDIKPLDIKERRNYIRTDVAVPVILYFYDEEREGTRESQGTTRNISATGLMVEIKHKVPIGTKVRLEIMTPAGSNPIHCSGQVVWLSQLLKFGRYNIGIEFTDIEEDNKNTFLRFLCDTIYKASSR